MSSFIGKLIRGQQAVSAPSGADIVEKLCDRVQSSTLLDDRRDAVRALKSLSKKYQLDVGTQAMDILINVLQNDSNDTEIISYALDTLCNVMSNEIFDEDIEGDFSAVSNDQLGSQFSEMFVKNAENITLLLKILEEYDFHVRRPCVRLITLLLEHRGKELQEVILVAPMGVSKLMDILSDSREVIRNDGLLLLGQLTKGNANIQKIVAFENAFERLLDISLEEGFSDGGIVVEDCLLLLINLLQNNPSNQTFFQEGSYIKRLPAFFDIDNVDSTWSAQKVTNVLLMLQLVRSLVTPRTIQAQLNSCQKAMNQCGLLDKLCKILMASGIPAEILTETIKTVAETIRGNKANQEMFASVSAPCEPPRPAIVMLLMSMVNEKQPFTLRCAVLYCFQCFLNKNEIGQSQIVATLLPSSADASSITAGQLLCGGLFSAEQLSTWLAAVALLHSIADNTQQKEQMLRVQLATSLGNPPVSLMQQCCVILTQNCGIQTKAGLLMMLAHWLTDCPIAVTHFLNISNTISFLISQISASEGDEYETIIQGLCSFLLGICLLYNSDNVEGANKHQILQLIERRIGVEPFSEKLTAICKTETYSRTAKKQEISYRSADEAMFDYEFTRLYRRLENDILRNLSGGSLMDNDFARQSASEERIKNLSKELDDKKKEEERLKLENENLFGKVQELADQNSLLKASNTSYITSDLNSELERLSLALSEKEKIIQEMKSETKAAVNGKHPDPDAIEEIQTLKARLETNRVVLEQREEEVRLYKEKFEALSKEIPEVQTTNNDTELKTRLEAVEKELSETKEELESIRKEQEDLLVLCSDQDTRLKDYRSKLRNLGEQVEDDDDDEEEEDFEMD